MGRTESWSSSGALDPVTFDRVVVNEGNGWGAEISDYYTVPVTGFYLVVLSVGAEDEKRVDVRLFQNSVSIQVQM